ncbi:MAG: O-antigen ligase family protein, partial [Verrucomicrobia bacterium]|nr:O-antigen ligase family protein [Verrucomicrobiota bacterium]
ACLLVGTIYQLTVRRRPLDNQQKVVFIFVSLAVLVSFIQAFLRPSGQSSSLQEFASEGAYLPLVFLVTVLFPAPGQVRRLLALTVVIYAPVAAYGIWQQYFGLSTFEINYLKSGLTSTLGLLDDIRIRPFSSLNSPHAFGATTAMLACLAAFFPLGDKRRRMWQYPLALLLFFGCLASVVRAAWVLIVLACIGFFCFRSRALTLVFYIFGLTAFSGILFNTQFVSNALERFDQYMPDDGDLESQAFRLGTFGARLDSFQNVLTNPNFHTLLGKSGAEIDELQGDISNLAHEQIGQILIRSGFVGLTLFLGTLVAGLIYAHVTDFRQTDPFRRDALVACLSIVFGTVGSGVLFGSSLGLFPVNILFALIMGVFFALSHPERAEANTGPKTEPSPSLESRRQQASRPS